MDGKGESRAVLVTTYVGNASTDSGKRSKALVELQSRHGYCIYVMSRQELAFLELPPIRSLPRNGFKDLMKFQCSLFSSHVEPCGYGSKGQRAIEDALFPFGPPLAPRVCKVFRQDLLPASKVRSVGTMLFSSHLFYNMR